MRLRWALVLLFFVSLGPTFWVYRTVPQAFVPEEDQGYFIIQVQAPAGASLEYTSKVGSEAEQILLKDPDVHGAVLGDGLQLQRRGPEPGHHVRPAQGRSTSGPATSTRCRRSCSRVQRPAVRDPRRDRRPVPAAVDPGPRAGSAASSSRCSTRPATDIQTLAQGTRAWSGAGNQSPKLRGLFSAFTANDPQLQVTIDRERAKALGLPLTEVTERAADLPRLAVRERLRLQQPRLPRLRAGGPALPRRARRICGSSTCARAAAQMVPLEQIVKLDETTSPQVISHFNLFRSADDQRLAAPGRQLGPGAPGDGAARDAQTLPPGMDSPGRASRWRKPRPGGSRPSSSGSALLLVYLTLAAQYQSLVLPFIILLGGAARGARRARRAVAARAGQRRLLPGRAGHADRAGGEERDPDRRVRRAAAAKKGCRSSTPPSRRPASGCGRS